MGGVVVKLTTEEYYSAMIGRLSPIITFVMCFESIVSVFTYLAVTFGLDRTRKEHLKAWNRLQSIDDEVVKSFPNVNWNYQKNCRKYTRLTAFIYSYFSIIAFGFVFNLANCSCGYFSSFLISFAYACITASSGLASFLFAVQMDMLRLRFRLLHKLVNLNFVSCSNGQRNDTRLLRKFKILEYFFKEYNALIHRLNRVFNVVSSASMFYDFAILTNMGFLVCSKAIESNTHWKEYVFIAFFTLPRIYKVIICSVYGHMAHAEIFNSIANYIIVLIQLQFQQNMIRRTLYGAPSGDIEMIEM
ncbi:putative gustatory receptor 47b [Musca domestica]|nr:putative gustatory receptor 47b [Musca domestica]